MFHSPELTDNTISYNNVAFVSCTDAKFCVSTDYSDAERLTPVYSFLIIQNRSLDFIRISCCRQADCFSFLSKM